MIHPRKCLPSPRIWVMLTGVFFGLAVPDPSLGQAKLGQPVSEEQVPSKGPSPVPQKVPVPLTQPEPEQLFRLESEDKLRERMHKEYLALGQKKVLFPPGARVTFLDKQPPFPQATAVLEPTGLCSRPLYFEDVPTERYGVYCPLAQPLISTSLFYLDTLCLPVNVILDPPWSLR
jgi:hypothetical protein